MSHEVRPMTPPLILAIDTTTPIQGLALADARGLVGFFSARIPGPHSESLLPNAEHLLGSCGVAKRSLGGIAAVTGPGSFTGIRIGLATARGLADSLGIPLIGRNALELLAGDPALADGPIAPVIEARRGSYYLAVFRREGGRLSLLEPYRELAAAPAWELLAIHPDAVLTGPGAPALGQELSPAEAPERAAAGNPEPFVALILARGVAAGRYRLGAVDDAVEAFYIRPPDARLPRRSLLVFPDGS